MARTGGGGGVLVFALLVVLAAGGAWNYRRNAEIDAAVPRPFRSYDDDDLVTLLEAHRHEAEALPRAGAPAPPGSGAPAPRFADRVREFERIQRKNDAARSLSASRLEHEVAIAQIETEQDYRRDESDRLRFHLRRLFTLPD